jgi:hypothetical protein
VFECLNDSERALSDTASSSCEDFVCDLKTLFMCNTYLE